MIMSGVRPGSGEPDFGAAERSFEGTGECSSHPFHRQLFQPAFSLTVPKVITNDTDRLLLRCANIPRMFGRLFRKNPPAPSGPSIVMLQRHSTSITTDELDRAMERAWRQRHDPFTFCARKGSQDDCIILKAFGETFEVSHATKC